MFTLITHTPILERCMYGKDYNLRMNTKNVCVIMKLDDMFRYTSSILNTIGKACAII